MISLALLVTLPVAVTSAGGFSVDRNCAGVNLRKKPCLVTFEECDYPIQPRQNSFALDPYPVCLPNGACERRSDVETDSQGHLYTAQNITLRVTDASALHYRRLHVRSSLDLGGLGSVHSKPFGRCITNKMISGDSSQPLQYAYGSCELDTFPVESYEQDLCELINGGAINTRDNMGRHGVIGCTEGLFYFDQQSACAQHNACEITIEFTQKYVEVSQIVYFPFRNKEITIHVEIFLAQSYAEDTSHIVTTPNEQCQQFEGSDKCLSYFYLKFYSDE